MAAPLKSFRARRWTLSLVTLLAAGLLAAGWALGRMALRPTAMQSGVLLLSLVTGLILFNARKKLPFMPLLKASTWLQLHIYIGWLTVVLYALHTGLRWPSGRLGVVLAVLFLVVAVSGVFGLWLSRWIPPRLTRSGESLIFERIPLLRHRLREEARVMAQQAVEDTHSTTLADFYLKMLGPYLAAEPGLLSPFLHDDRQHHRVEAELRELRRYLASSEMVLAERLEEIIEAKRNLDQQLAGQRLLKLWLFVHIPLSYGLLVLSLVHGWLALRYSGRW
jgi:hypothetical protein